jgi:hypothetical protein
MEKSPNPSLPSLTDWLQLPTLQQPNRRVANRRHNLRTGEAQQGNFLNLVPENLLPLRNEKFLDDSYFL